LAGFASIQTWVEWASRHSSGRCFTPSDMRLIKGKPAEQTSSQDNPATLYAA
jgi:hypothetical protein